MTLPITVLLKISIWHQMDIGTNVDRNIYTLAPAHACAHAFSLTHTHKKHLVTVNRCQGHYGGSQVLARYHIKNNTYLTHC